MANALWRCGGWGACALLLAPLVVGSAVPAAALECGETVTGTATLEEDLRCTVSPALTIDGGDLDLDGHSVVCAGTSEGVVLEGRGARLADGAVTGCEIAVVVAGGGGHEVRRVVASGSSQGIRVESSGNRIRDNAVLRGGSDAAVQVDGSANTLVRNHLTGAMDQGFEVRGDRNLFARNRIGGVAEGLELRGSGNVVRHNDIVGATDSGIEVRGDGNDIRFNRIADGAADGIAIRSSDNVVDGNTIYGSGDEGIFVFAGAMRNALRANRVLGSGTDLLDANPDCDDNTWEDNTFETADSDDCID